MYKITKIYILPIFTNYLQKMVVCISIGIYYQFKKTVKSNFLRFFFGKNRKNRKK